MTATTGLMTVYTLENTAEKGSKPVEKLVKFTTLYYGYRTISYNRLYAAQGVNEQIDALVRVKEDAGVTTKMYAVLEDTLQYRITGVVPQYLSTRYIGTDLTLERLDKNYDIASV